MPVFLPALFLIAAETEAPSQVDTFIKVTDVAARASDRWLMLGSLILLLAFMWLVIRHLLKDKEAARAAYETAIKDAYAQAATARQEHNAIMKEMYGEQTKLAAELLIALQQNRELMDKVKMALERIAQKQ